MSPSEQQPDGRQTWEEVLASVEDDLAGTARLLERDVSAPVTDPAPAELQLPPARVAGPELPPLASMPPVPRHLLERIESARSRVEELQQALRAELAALDGLRAQQVAHTVRAARFASAGRAAVARAAFIDTHA